MKKYLSLVFALILTLSVCACTAEPTDTPAVTTDGVSDTVADTTEDTTEAETTGITVIRSDKEEIQNITEFMPPYFGNILELAKDSEPFISKNLKELMATSGKNPIAVRYLYGTTTDDGIVYSDPIADKVIENEDPRGEYAELTADEINAICDKAKGKSDVRFAIICDTDE